ncbi:MAG TPA: DUF4156 domain-containing protein [Nitrosomonas sp.]|uniref:DUF4156 domain-containing protein n=1 Tax=Nitrosomonas sp. TaxID=42353 RepID=UPI000E9BB716|nr:DUF4156 domain-containing protein [Nitrosomonas sp.]GJL74186.1 MAG: lipoprotein [Nitrosomonas sp.]HBV21975.1 DUF4156 domain-containing protein [Nitrosomonas sp.]HNP27066.1 DUF4156 domain-containing protein [Nitrosomonas sp.]
MIRISQCKICLILVVIGVLAGCSAISAKPKAQSVAILTDAPDTDRCRLLGEVAGSQGNWFTGAYTSDKNLLVGARNDLRNAAYELGGNAVHVQHVSNSGRYEASGNANTTIIGNAYDCQ